jgi:putative DNA methylase
LPVAERARQLFGDEGAAGLADRIELAPASARQLELFPEARDAAEPQPRGRRRRFATAAAHSAVPQATTLDRVHAAMLLQASGRTNGLRALLAAEQERGPDFLRLGNALTALYPQGSEEKRLLDAMLLAVPAQAVFEKAVRANEARMSRVSGADAHKGRGCPRGG